MRDQESSDLSEERADAADLPEVPSSRPRAVGSPLSMGASRRVARPTTEEEIKQFQAPETEPLPESRLDSEAESPNVQRAASFLRTVIPFVQRLLPLLDGNIGSAVSNLLAPHPHAQPSPAPVKVDLVPLEDGLAELRSQQHGLRLQVTEQNTSLKRVEDQLELVREATDRNTLEQQELLEDMKAFETRMKFVAFLVLALVAGGFLLTLAIFLHLRKVLP